MKRVDELMKDTGFTHRLLSWAMGDDRCASSLTLARVITGMNFDPIRLSVPVNQINFGNCCRLLDMVPELRDHLGKVKDVAPEWTPVIDNWESLEYLYRNKRNEFARQIPFVLDESTAERKNDFSVFAINSKDKDGVVNVPILSMHPFLQKEMHNGLSSHPGGNEENRFSGLSVLFVPQSAMDGFTAISKGVLKRDEIDVSPNVRFLSGINVNDHQKFSMIIGPYPLEIMTNKVHVKVEDKYHAGIAADAPALKQEMALP